MNLINARHFIVAIIAAPATPANKTGPGIKFLKVDRSTYLPTSIALARFMRRLAASLTCAICTATAWSQTTPNWGALGAAQAPAPAPAASVLQGVKPGTTAAPGSALGAKAAPSATTPAAQPLAELLKRPDTDVITSADGKKTTVGAIRKQVAQRQAVQDALRAGKLPPGWKATKSATVSSPQRAQLLNASVTLRNMSRTEAAAALKAAPQKAAVNSPSVVSPLANKAARESATTEMARPKTELKPGIFLVNGKHKGVQFTPGGTYTIDGLGFGTTVGQVDLVSKQLPNGTLALQVSKLWSDGQVQALIPEPIRGLPDQPVTLRVTTRDGTLFSLDAQFVATREEIVLHSADGSLPLARAFKFAFSNMGDWGNDTTNIFWGNTVGRHFEGANINCPNSGNDTLTPTLPAGWTLSSVTPIGNTPSTADSKHDAYGNDGNTVVSSNYALVDWKPFLTYEQLVVQWGVFRTHTSPEGNHISAHDECRSQYSLDATVVGPAGFKPF